MEREPPDFQRVQGLGHARRFQWIKDRRAVAAADALLKFEPGSFDNFYDARHSVNFVHGLKDDPIGMVQLFRQDADQQPRQMQKVWKRKVEQAVRSDHVKDLLERRRRLFQVFDGFHEQTNVEKIPRIFQPVDVAGRNSETKSGISARYQAPICFWTCW